MFRRIVWAGAMLVAAADARQAAAQIYPRAPRGQGLTAADYWVGVSYGLFELGTYQDGKTNTTWQFGYTSELAATLEKSLSAGSAVGVMAGFASPRLNYFPSNTFLDCSAGNCTARADVTQILGTGRIGGGLYGFRSSLVLEAGATQFSNFRDQATGDKLPGGGSWDLTFGTGYDLGISVAQKTDFYLETNLLWVLHDPGNNVSATPPFNYALKIGLRQGF